MTKTQKILILVIILLVLLVGTFLIYYFFFQAKPSGLGTATIEQALTQEQTTTPAALEKIIPLSQEKVLAPTLDASGKKIKFYSQKNGELYQVNFDGTNAAKVSGVKLTNLLKILWAPDKEKVIGFFQEGDKIKQYLYDYKTGQSTLLNETIKQIAWSPDNQKMAVLHFDANTNTNVLSLASPDGSGWQDLFQTRLTDVVLEWPVLETITLRTLPSGSVEGLVLAINAQTGDFHRLLSSNLYGLNLKWSPWGNQIIYSATSDGGQNMQLYAANTDGSNSKKLNLATWVEKCVFGQDNRTLFCAAPEEIPSYAILPDDAYKGLLNEADVFWKINLETAEKETIFEPRFEEDSYDADNLFLSPKEDYLFFINKKDGRLYGLKLE